MGCGGFEGMPNGDAKEDGIEQETQTSQKRSKNGTH